MFTNLFKRKRQTVNTDQPVTMTPNKMLPRHPCPFYGFIPTPIGMMDQQGNRCCLREGERICKMEDAEQKPNLATCPFLQQNFLRIYEMLKSDLPVFPAEFGPAKGGWKGMPMDKWNTYVMGTQPPRPN